MFSRLTTLSVAIAAAVTLFSSCKKESADPVQAGTLSIHFDNIVSSFVEGSAPTDLVLGTGTYTNSAGESFTVTKLKYYISNISLKKEDGTYYVVPQDSSYFLIDEQAYNQDAALHNVPAGNYVGIRFTVGVDSARSVMEVARRTGVLDVADSATGKDMYWVWNSGYIHYKFEGTSTAIMGGMGNNFLYHIGGYGGKDAPTLNNTRVVTLAFPTAAIVAKGRAPEAHTYHNILKTLSGPGQNTSFATGTMAMVMTITPGAKIADNYAQSFVVGHVHND